MVNSISSNPPLELFYSYSHLDEGLRDKLQTHLASLKREGLIKEWHDRQIMAGTEWGGEIDEHLNSADIILLLVSADFINSDYCNDLEVELAMKRHEAKEARVIPIILRPCDWMNAPFGKLQALPKNGEPITVWRDEEEACLNIAKGIRAVVKEIAGDPSRTRIPTPSTPACPSPPPLLGKYITRETTAHIVQSLLAASGNICVVYGPSGYGKSTLAAQVFKEWDSSQRYWFDCEHPISPKYHLQSGSLLVVENLDHVYKADSTANADFNLSRLYSIMPWLNDVQGCILALTRKEEVARRFLSDLGRRSDPAVQMINIGQGFSLAECRQFLARTLSGDELSEQMGIALNQYIRGCPFIWQLLLELIYRNALQEIYIAEPDSLDQTKVRKKVYEVWFRETKLNNPLTIRASQVLCRVSLFAMDTTAIAFLLNENEMEINVALEPLIQSGFIRRACLGDCSWTPHALYREACKAVPDKGVDEALLRPRYRDYLRQTLNDPSDDKVDFLTKIDAWIVGVQQAFDVVARRDIPLKSGQPDFTGFFTQYRELSTDLRKIFEDGQRYGMQFNWLAEAFREQIESMSCRELIGVAQVMSLVPKRNKAIAEIMWLALSPMANISWFSAESDSWARAESIHTSAIHWSGQGDEIKQEGAKRLLTRAEECLDNIHISYPEATQELCAIFGGLCLLDSYDVALDLLRDSSIQFLFPDVCLAILLFLLENDKSLEAYKFLAEFWSNIPAGWQRILLESYLVSKGIEVPQSSINEVTFVPNYISFLARMAYAENFEIFVYNLASAGQAEWVDSEQISLRVKGFRSALSL
jgi:hypothetical protein